MAPRDAPPPARKLRILALHGFLQNAEGFRKRTGSLRKALKSHAELFFLQAPHVVRLILSAALGKPARNPFSTFSAA
jgi:hypothetical protein